MCNVHHVDPVVVRINDLSAFHFVFVVRFHSHRYVQNFSVDFYISVKDPPEHDFASGRNFLRQVRIWTPRSNPQTESYFEKQLREMLVSFLVELLSRKVSTFEIFGLENSTFSSENC